MGKFIPFYQKKNNYSQIRFKLQKTNNNDRDHDNNIVFASHLRSGCLFGKTYFHAVKLNITLTDRASY